MAERRLHGLQRVLGSGRFIVEQARGTRAHALVMPLPPRTGTTLCANTVETVLAECQVIIEPGCYA